MEGEREIDELILHFLRCSTKLHACRCCSFSSVYGMYMAVYISVV